MSLELMLILGFIFHFVGDYLLQNNWMAQTKTSKNLPALIHAFVYTVPFVLFGIMSPLIAAVSFWTHFYIDRFRLAQYWIKLMNWSWKESNYGFGDKTPTWLSTWLMIIIDNTFHIILNSIFIYLTFKYRI